MISEIIDLETDQRLGGTNPHFYIKCYFFKIFWSIWFFFLHSLSTDSVSESIENSLHHMCIMKETAYLRNQLKFNLPPPDHPSAAVPREGWRELKEKPPWNTHLELMDSFELVVLGALVFLSEPWFHLAWALHSEQGAKGNLQTRLDMVFTLRNFTI